MAEPLRAAPVHAYPRLSKADFWLFRIGGDGLGNLLFNWARCLITARRHGWRLIWPTWLSCKPKNWRVNPYDLRTYWKLFRRPAEYIGGPRKLARLALGRWLSEAEAAQAAPPPGSVVVFRGMAGKFQPFLEELETVKSALLEMTRPEHLTGYRDPDPPPVAIHVRLGDFVRRPDLDSTIRSDNSVLPLEWYMAALQAVRDRLGRPVEARLFSDGSDEELRPLLAMGRVKRVTYGSSIADLLALSRSRFLIASGSTFSMWPSYLGQVPTLWHPGKLLQSVHLGPRRREIEWAAGEPLPEWISL